MTKFNTLRRIMDVTNNIMSILCGFLLFIIMILLTLNVLFREIGIAIGGLSNLSVLVLIAVVYLGLAGTEQMKQHAAVEIVNESLGKRSRRIMDIIIHLIKLATIIVFLYVSYGNMLESFQTNESFADVVRIPIWPAKVALVTGLFLFTIQILLNLLVTIIDKNYLENEDTLLNDPAKNI